MATYVALAWAIASGGFALLHAGDATEMLRSSPSWLYPWLITNHLASAVVLVAILPVCVPSLDRWLQSHWGHAVALAWLIMVGSAFALLRVAAR